MNNLVTKASELIYQMDNDQLNQDICRAPAFYLYQNPGEMDSVISQGKDLVNQGAVIVQEHTK